MNKSDGLIIGYDNSPNKDDTAILVVGRRVNGEIKVINAFEGADALALYEMLTTTGTGVRV